MATKYADFDLATGNNDGSDWTNAWKTMADAIAGSNSASPVKGDTVLCKGTDTLASGVTNNLSGDASDLIRWIGVDGSGNNVGGSTRAVLNANGGAFTVLSVTGAYNVYENFRFTGSSNLRGFYPTGGRNTCINCCADNNGGDGFYTYAAQTNCILCVAYSNGGNGWLGSNATRLIMCCSHDNVGDGFYYGFTYVIGCVAYDNGDKGLDSISDGVIINCVFDNNAGGGVTVYSVNSETPIMIGNRITNQSGAGDIGLEGSTKLLFYGWNCFDGNTDHMANMTKTYALLNGGAATNSELNENGAGGGDTLQGYVSTTEGSEDYSTAYTSGTDPHLRRTAITIPTS